MTKKTSAFRLSDAHKWILEQIAKRKSRNSSEEIRAYIEAEGERLGIKLEDFDPKSIALTPSQVMA
jgi:predicted DNA-binding protein